MLRLHVRLFLLWSVTAIAPCLGQEPNNSPEGIAFFEKNIRPVLVAECYECHSTEKGKKVRGGLALDSREGLRKGGESGPVLVPNKPAQSLLIKALRHSDPKLAMPPKKKLADDVIRTFEEWIRLGAPDPRTAGAVKKDADPTQGRNHWAYQPPRAPPIPTVKNTTWPRTDIDRFIVAALEHKGLTPVADAARRTLLRRLTFDLTGLPPTPAEMDAFLADTSPKATEKVVDRLLASAAFGEKWARHWLDVARFAESTGKTVNFNYPQAWRYRDYVIAAFNRDKPFDQFIKEQLAGDLLPTDDPNVRAERLIATGFLALGPKTLNERSGLKFELDMVDEQIDVTTQAFLGITAACARCHDHKFDPFPQKDYYALAGIFRSTETYFGTVRYINAQRATELLTLPPDAKPPVGTAKLSASERTRLEEQIKNVRDAMKSMKDGTQQFFASGQIALLQARLDGYDAEGNPKLLAMGVRDKPVGPERPRGKFGGFAGFTYDGSRTVGDSPLYVRGEPDQPSASRVPRGTLHVLAAKPLTVPASSSGRLELAEWIAHPNNPLTARVFVNRVWLQLFGRGLVPTAHDFGVAGRPPTHPELLDHLAVRFASNGWKIKGLIKEIVLSRVYQLGSTTQPHAMEHDPGNTLLWRMTPRRLEAESLRDALLAISGQLTTTPPVGSVVARAGEGPLATPRGGGESVLTAINDPRNTHRSIYLPVIRDNLAEALALFDGADPALIAADRPTTTVPSQGLYLLNNALVLRAADALAESLMQAHATEAARVQGAFQRVYGRPATPKEQARAEGFLKDYRTQLGNERGLRSPEKEALGAFTQALFASAEFLYRQ